MKKLRKNHANKDKKKVHVSKKRGSNRSRGKAPATRRRVVEVISRDELSKMDLKFNDLDYVMNDKFSEVLKSLKSKNKNVEKEGIAKQSQKEVEHSNDVSDVVGHTNPISTHIDSDKSVKMEVAEVNQKPLPVKEGPHSEMTVHRKNRTNSLKWMGPTSTKHHHLSNMVNMMKQ
ncbi:hypothetical protein FXO38_11779 [Capsicum annuum]|nr:hypothetical protein FXO37_28610 [Capsicum annuum]KAF3661285.1 hypothetical protein FXO38_11779 [Capsicum annuum]